MRQRRKELGWILVISILLTTFIALIQIPIVKAEPTATYNDSGTVVTIHSCDLIVQITKARASYAQGARVTSIIYDDHPNIVNANPAFGLVTVKRADEPALGLYPNTATLIESSGNDTNKLALTFKCVGLVDGDGVVKVNVDTTLTYTFYSDTDTFFINVLLESAQTDWLYQYSNYGTSMRFSAFQSYTATSSVDNRVSSGDLLHNDKFPVDMDGKNILTVMDSADNIAVTLFSTSLKSQLYGQIFDGSAETRVMIRNTPPRTWDKVGNNQAQWYEGASYWGSGISYSCGWAFSTDGAPFMVTPWIMPSATPYGLMWTLDDLPSVPDGYSHYPPDPAATSMGNLTTWLSGNNERKVTILWVYDPLSTPQQTPVAGGFDGSWDTHGNWRVANMSDAVKSYYNTLYNNQVQYGTHAYHHDYPWTFEFSSITNTTNLNSTWNQIYQDAQALLGNKTLDVFKPAGFKTQPQILNVITKYGIEHYDAGADPHSIPMLGFFIDDVGNKLIITNDQMAISDDVNNGISNTTIYNDIIANASAFGLVTNAGHWLSGTANQTTFNEIFDSVDSYFGGNFTYFYADDLNNYWNDVLWDNSYTFNSTQVSSTSSDSRLTYKLWNKPLTFTESGVHPIAEGLVLYSPNAPVVGYVHVWGYPGGLLDPAGSISTGQAVRIFAGVTDAETPSDQLSVTIKYKAQADSVWTSVPALWEPLYGGYWYYDWAIPGGVSSGLYDVRVVASDGNGGYASVTEYGEFTVVAQSNADPVVNYVHVWGYPGGLLDPAGTINAGESVRIFAGVVDTETPSDQLSVTIRYKAQSDSVWTSVPAQWESLYGGYWYYDWVIPGGVSSGLYDVTVEVLDGNGGSVSVTEYGEFTVVSFNADPAVAYVHVWGYPGGLLDPAGTINTGEAVRIFAGVVDAETASEDLSVTIKYKAESDSVWTSVDAVWEPLYGGYWYYDWVIPGGVSSGPYDVRVEASDPDGGFVSVTEYGEFTVVVSNANPVVNYVHVWGYPGGLLDPAGSISTGQAVRIFAGVTDAETPSDQLSVTISYKAQSDSVWTSVPALWEPLYGGYWYYDWAIPQGVSSGLYDVLVEASDADGGFVSVTEFGEFTVVSSNADPVVNYVHVWGYPGGLLDPAGTIKPDESVRIFTGITDTETPSNQLTVTIKYKAQADPEWTSTLSQWESDYGGYWYFDWVIPGGVSLGLYDVLVEASDGNGGSASVTEYGEFTVVAYDDIIFDSSFETGNLKNVQFQSGDALGNRLYTGEQDHTTVSGMTDKHWWFYFSMDNVAGKTVTIRLVNNEVGDMVTRWGGMEPVYSFDNINWERLPLSNFTVDISGRSFQMNVTLGPTENKIWLAPLPPYTISMRDALFNEFASSPYLNVTSLGTTPGGQELKVATITDKTYDDANKIKAYVIAMQHSTEVPGGWEADGMIRFLLSDDPTAQAIRRSYIFKIVPIVNVDGVYYGISRYTPLRDGVQYDLNRWWSYSISAMPFEVAKIFTDIQTFQPNSFNDIHSTIGAEGNTPEDAVTYTWNTSDPTVVAFLNKIRDAGWPDTYRGTSGYACSQVHSRLGVVRSISWENPQDEFITDPGHKLTVNDWREMGKVYAIGVYLDGGALANVTPFSLVVLPDTQIYSQNYPFIFDNQTRWIVDNAVNMNILFVLHEGDIVNTDVVAQWANANSSMSRLDGNIPWAVLPGNHDGTNVGALSENLANYTTYFPYSRFDSETWYGDAYNSINTNSFVLFSGGEDEYIVFNFQYHPSDAVLAWANSTIATYPNRRAIVVTHDYLNTDETRTAEGGHIWNSFVSHHADQIFLVLCGHMHGEASRQDTVNGHVVYQLLADYQGRTNGGDGLLRILEFHPAQDIIYVKTFTPYHNTFETDANSQFTLNYDMSGLVTLTSADLNLTGDYRWKDVANQNYSSGYRNSYNYSQAIVHVVYNTLGDSLTGRLIAQNLKPNFAYQIKLVGTSGTADNELIGFAGRWWQEEWNGTAWTNGKNLNDKGNGSSLYPNHNPNDELYLARNSTTDATSPTGLHYRYTGYLLLGYFITDSNGDVTLYFETGSCYHVLWKTSQRARTGDDGPLKTVTFDPAISTAYDVDYASSTVSIFGEWERLPMGSVNLAAGSYNCQIVLTEESFHGTGPLEGNWAAAIAADVSFTIVA